MCTLKALGCPHLSACIGTVAASDLAKLFTDLSCGVCKRRPWNLWLCLYPNCRTVGCSDDEEGSPDHSTKHQEQHRSHLIQLNIRTRKLWCYGCFREVTSDFTDWDRSDSMMEIPLPDEARAPTVSQQETQEKRRNMFHGDTDPGGMVGLLNLGNTCYMNAALQCLSNVPALTDFFLTCPGLVENSGINSSASTTTTAGTSTNQRNSLSVCYMNHLRDVWATTDGGSGFIGGRGFYEGNPHVAPTRLVSVFKRNHPTFRGFHQQDSQEFLKYFLDHLHEELMEPVPVVGADDETTEEDQKLLEHEDGDDDDDVGCASRSSEERNERGGEEDEEYETADSGVSEQSTVSTCSSLSGRKRKHNPGAMGHGDDAEPEVSLASSGVSSLNNYGGVGGGATDAGGKVGTAASTNSHGGTGTDVPRKGEEDATNVESNQKFRKIASPPKHRKFLQKRKPKLFRSVVSDIFDGKLVSTVQCLTCSRISTTTETFQDLSLPIPTQDSIQNTTVRNQRLLSASSSTAQQSSSPSSSPPLSLASSLNPGLIPGLNLATVVDPSADQYGWLSWIWSWISSWFYGPNITLHDCLAYFFSADELKGDNMYSCEKCKKLRNGLKYSRVTVLPDTLCIHLKRFRHDFSFSSKISSKVTFPLVDLDLSPWLHQDCISKETHYDLTGIVCHRGTAGGGHYTAYALNSANQEWYEFDDSYVRRVDPSVVLAAEAYVLFYRKNNIRTEEVKFKVQELLRQDQDVPSLVKYYVSRQWLNKLENFAEPGPIDNSDFLCRHGGILPNKENHVSELCVEFPRSVWELLHSQFGSVQLGRTSPAGCTRLHQCNACKSELEALTFQKFYELEEFKRLHQEFQLNPDEASVIFCMAPSWFKNWEAFVTGRARDPPGEIDNRGIVESVTNRNPVTGAANTVQVLRNNSDHLRVSHGIWNLFHSIYGGGPELVLRTTNGVSFASPPSPPEADVAPPFESSRIGVMIQF